MNCDYAAICYIYYANEIAECFEMTIRRTCDDLLQAPVVSENDDITIGTALFDVYLALKRFATQSAQFCSETTQLKIHNYHEWFADGVAHWIDMHHFTAFARIKKAIDVDKLMPMDEMVKYSTSSVDTLAIFQTIKKFWVHLNWPDVESAYTFMAKIVDNICHCCVLYADGMADRILDSNHIEHLRGNEEFYVTPSLCLIINNIEYLHENLPIFITELGPNEIIAKLTVYRSHADAQRCERTVKSLVENATDTIENQITDLIDCVAYKMCTHLHKCIREAAECLHRDSHLTDQLMEMLEKSLHSLRTYLNEINFQRILAAVWQKFNIFFSTLLQNCLNVRMRKSHQFFSFDSYSQQLNIF